MVGEYGIVRGKGDRGKEKGGDYRGDSSLGFGQRGLCVRVVSNYILSNKYTSMSDKAITNKKSNSKLKVIAICFSA